jgi:hypothetical protein
MERVKEKYAFRKSGQKRQLRRRKHKIKNNIKMNVSVMFTGFM